MSNGVPPPPIYRLDDGKAIGLPSDMADMADKIVSERMASNAAARDYSRNLAVARLEIRDSKTGVVTHEHVSSWNVPSSSSLPKGMHAEPLLLAKIKNLQAAHKGESPSLGGATAWLNSPPLTAAGLRGKVVLIDFWTYSCINWIRSLPHVRAWAEKYKNQGLVVIGVHTPEFAFEKNVDNVRRAAKDMRVDYPIAIDNDYAIWRAFKNEYWPALYFVDSQGHIRHHHFGEGEYDQSEMIIQQLLSEAGIGGIGHELVSVDAHGAEAAADWGSMKSPETYVGYERAENFASPAAQYWTSVTSMLPLRI